MKSRKLKVKVVTLFPGFIEAYAGFGIIKRAVKNRVLVLEGVDLRKFAFDKRGTVDDRPYGGGVGMVLRPDVIHRAVTKLRSKGKSRVVLLTPQGKTFDQAAAKKLSRYDEIVLICGRYEGFDERVRKVVDEEVSIGDYVLMGGELAALVVTEAVIRLVPGVLGKDESAAQESFSEGLLEYPQYTKPEIMKIGGKNWRVPPVLLSGHHGNVAEWRQKQALLRTRRRRPDLYDKLKP